MSSRKALVIALGALALVVAATGLAFWRSVASFGAIAAELPLPPDTDVFPHALARARADHAEARDDDARWAAAPPLALAEAVAGDAELGARLADQLLAEAPTRRADWNYGNAIHYAHLAKGRIAFARGDREAARAHLRAAAAVPGSPQLDSFGPRMILARDLLRAGERQEVLNYIDATAAFWKHDAGALEKWREMIHKGREPNFALNLL